eukprot:EG_transcript_31825
MAKRQNLVWEASLKAPPSLELFVAEMQKAAAVVKNNPEDPVNGPLFRLRPKKPDSQNMQRASLAQFLSFVDLCNQLGVKYSSIDEFLRAWGRRCIQAVFLFDEQETIEVCNKQREEQNVSVRETSADSWRNHVNALMRVYNQRVPDVFLVASAPRQFPLLNELSHPL